MKKVILTMIVCFGVIAASAQRLGVKAGLNIANATYEISDADLSTKSLTGPLFGLVADFNLANEWSLNSGLLYTQKGIKMDFGGIEAKIPVSYLEIPANFAYKYELESIALFAQAGPYAAIGLSAKAKAGGEEEKIEFGSGDEQIKQLDAGLNIGAGIEIGQLQLNANYGFGLINIENADEAKMKHSVFSISLAYFFLN